MDPVTAALSQAWLQAVSRIESQPTAQPNEPGPPQTMVDVFVRVLRNADPQTGSANGAGRVLDRLA
jgi:hypothetical protein